MNKAIVFILLVSVLFIFGCGSIKIIKVEGKVLRTSNQDIVLDNKEVYWICDSVSNHLGLVRVGDTVTISRYGQYLCWDIDNIDYAGGQR